jgi:hypothetical protein
VVVAAELRTPPHLDYLEVLVVEHHMVTQPLDQQVVALLDKEILVVVHPQLRLEIILPVVAVVAQREQVLQHLQTLKVALVVEVQTMLLQALLLTMLAVVVLVRVQVV